MRTMLKSAAGDGAAPSRGCHGKRPDLLLSRVSGIRLCAPGDSDPYSAYGYYGYGYPGYYQSSDHYPAARYPAPLAHRDPYAYACPYSAGVGPRASGHMGY